MSGLFNAANEPALISGVVAFVSTAVTSVITVVSIGKKAKHDFRLETTAEAVAKVMLQDDQWEVRSFRAFQSKLRGIQEDDLRKILIRAGAVSVMMDDQEVWGLVSRNPDLLIADKIPGRLQERCVSIYLRGEQMEMQQQQMQQRDQQAQQKIDQITASLSLRSKKKSGVSSSFIQGSSVLDAEIIDLFEVIYPNLEHAFVQNADISVRLNFSDEDQGR